MSAWNWQAGSLPYEQFVVARFIGPFDRMNAVTTNKFAVGHVFNVPFNCTRHVENVPHEQFAAS